MRTVGSKKPLGRPARSLVETRVMVNSSPSVAEVHHDLIGPSQSLLTDKLTASIPTMPQSTSHAAQF
jgi:hypothetical protein